jgi:predicted RNA binding protein YcfA (HicA-like mRNA interferase family)
MLRRYGYQTTRQAGSHVRLETKLLGTPHRITIPDHDNLRVGTLNAILSEVSDYLKMDRSNLAKELFGK